MKKLLPYFKGYVWSAVWGPLLKLVEAILELLVPLIVAKIIDEAIPTGDMPLIIRYIVILVVIAVMGLASSLTAQFLSAKAAVGYAQNLTDDLFDHVMALPKESHSKLSSSSLVSRLTGDTFQIQSGLNTFFRLFLRSPFIVFGSLIMASQIDGQMTLIFSGMIVLLFAVVGGIIILANPIYQRIRQNFDQLVKLTQEQMEGMRVIRAFGQTEREVVNFESNNHDLANNQLVVGFINAFTSPLTYIIVNLCLVLVIYQGGGAINLGHLTQGQLVALINYLLAILVELVKITFVVTKLNAAYISAKRVLGVLDEDVENPVFTQASMDTGLISFDHVTFTYPDAVLPTLIDLDFVIQPGDFLGIIGSTGSGKTTLLQLLTKAYDPTEGDVDFNTAYFDTSSRKKVREAVSVVLGKVSLFQGTIRSNLLLANPQATEEMMWQALADAQALEFVQSYKEGLDKKVDAFGRNFSGGQRQRMTIARALLKEAQVYIFDDSTSALDYVTEANFQKTLKERYKDKTIIMISQRTHSLQTADNILVLEEGKQIGWGTHQSLLVDNPVYQEIHASQTTEEE